jgi:hypothetical protein
MQFTADCLLHTAAYQPDSNFRRCVLVTGPLRFRIIEILMVIGSTLESHFSSLQSAARVVVQSKLMPVGHTAHVDGCNDQ